MRNFLVLFIQLVVGLSSLAGNGYIEEINSLKYRLTSAKSATDQIILLNKLSLKYNVVNLDSSIYYARSALSFAKHANNKNQLADCYYSLGIAFRNMGILDSAGSYLFGALDAFTNIEKKTATTIAIGEYYRANSELGKAGTYIYQAISKIKESKRKDMLPYAFNRLAAVYFEMSVNNAVIDGIFEDTLYKTIALVDSSLYWSEKLNTTNYHVSNYNILGACYQKIGEYDKAIIYLNLALREAKRNNEIMEMPMLYRNISLNYLKTKKFGMAKEMALTGARMADSLKTNSGLAFNYYALMLIGEETHDDKLSYNYLKKRDSVQYLINSEIAIAKEKELETKYKTKEREMLIEQQHANLEKKQRQYLYSMLGFLSALVIIIGGAFFTIRLRKVNKMLDIKNKETERSSQEVVKLSEFKNDLMGMIVHDLKNPLNTIINFSKVQNKKLRSDLEQTAAEVNVESSAKNMLNLVNNIIDLQKFEEAKMNLALKDNSLSSIIEDALQNVKLLIQQKNISIKAELKTNVISKCDKDLVERVLVNMLTNAIKFSHNNETIIIKQEFSEGVVKTVISDQGHGIASDKISVLFNKFGRDEVRHIGLSISSGLGLAFSKMVVDAHGGKIGVNSELGKGASFWFTLNAESNSEMDKVNKQSSLEPIEKYSHDFLKIILPLKKELTHFQFYETSEILNSIRNFESGRTEYNYWKNEVENAVLFSNKKKYYELISFNDE